jgi:hypothetical protein
MHQDHFGDVVLVLDRSLDFGELIRRIHVARNSVYALKATRAPIAHVSLIGVDRVLIDLCLLRARELPRGHGNFTGTGFR